MTSRRTKIRYDRNGAFARCLRSILGKREEAVSEIVSTILLLAVTIIVLATAFSVLNHLPYSSSQYVDAQLGNFELVNWENRTSDNGSLVFTMVYLSGPSASGASSGLEIVEGSLPYYYALSSFNPSINSWYPELVPGSVINFNSSSMVSEAGQMPQVMAGSNVSIEIIDNGKDVWSSSQSVQPQTLKPEISNSWIVGSASDIFYVCASIFSESTVKVTGNFSLLYGPGTWNNVILTSNGGQNCYSTRLPPVNNYTYYEITAQTISAGRNYSVEEWYSLRQNATVSGYSGYHSPLTPSIDSNVQSFSFSQVHGPANHNATAESYISTNQPDDVIFASLYADYYGLNYTISDGYHLHWYNVTDLFVQKGNQSNPYGEMESWWAVATTTLTDDIITFNITGDYRQGTNFETSGLVFAVSNASISSPFDSNLNSSWAKAGNESSPMVPITTDDAADLIVGFMGSPNDTGRLSPNTGFKFYNITANSTGSHSLPDSGSSGTASAFDGGTISSAVVYRTVTSTGTYDVGLMRNKTGNSIDWVMSAVAFKLGSTSNTTSLELNIQPEYFGAVYVTGDGLHLNVTKNVDINGIETGTILTFSAIALGDYSFQGYSGTFIDSNSTNVSFAVSGNGTETAFFSNTASAEMVQYYPPVSNGSFLTHGVRAKPFEHFFIISPLYMVIETVLVIQTILVLATIRMSFSEDRALRSDVDSLEPLAGSSTISSDTPR